MTNITVLDSASVSKSFKTDGTGTDADPHISHVVVDTAPATAVTNAGITTIAGAVAGTEMQVDVLTMPTVTVNSHAVTNAGTFAVQATLAAGTAEVGKLAAGTALIGKVGIDQVSANANEVVVKSITAGDNNIGNVDVVTMPVTHVIADSGTVTTITNVVHVDDNAGALTVDGSVAATLAAETTKVIGTVNIAASQSVGLSTGSNAIGKLAANSGVDIGDVDVLSMPGTGVEDAAETAGGTLLMAGAVRRDTCASSSGASGDNSTINTDAVGALWTDPQGNVAHDTADAGNPVKVGAKAITALSGMTVVAAGDRTDLYADEDGVLITKQWVSNNDILCERVSNTNGTSTASTVFGATANCYNMITTIVVHNAHATTNGYVDLLDGSGGTIIMTIPLPANGGSVINMNVPLRQPTANTALYYDVSAAITTVYITFVGYKSKA